MQAVPFGSAAAASQACVRTLWRCMPISAGVSVCVRVRVRVRVARSGATSPATWQRVPPLAAT